DRPVSRSVMILTDSTSPNWANKSLRSFSDVWKARFPTKIFFAILVLPVYLSGTSRSFAEGRSEKESTLRTETGGSKPNSQLALLVEINNMLNQGICQRASSSAADPAVSELSHMVNFDCLGKTMCECLIR